MDIGTIEFLRLTGLTERILYYWINQGVITPHRNGPGNGGPGHRYCPADVAHTRILWALREHLTLAALHPVAQMLAEAMPEDEFELAHFLEENFLIVSPTMQLVNEMELRLYARRGPMVWSVVPLSCGFTRSEVARRSRAAVAPLPLLGR